MWDDPLNIPAVAAVVSALLFVLALSVIHPSAKTHAPERDSERQKLTPGIQRNGGKTVVAHNTIRLLCTSGLVVITAYQSLTRLPTEGDEARGLLIRLAATYVSVSEVILCLADDYFSV